MKVATLAEQINTAAAGYRVGSLQQFRANIHGKGPRTRKIFHAQTIMKTYAFHDGGRTELQFNVGIEWLKGKPWWRHGVAFSFGRGITLPDPVGTLGPKVNRFNSWVRTSGDLLDGFKMWHWDGERSADRSPGEIPVALLEAQAFVFLGAMVREAKVDVDRILRDFDILYPLYQFVESVTVP